jgi:hypothetical protein
MAFRLNIHQQSPVVVGNTPTVFHAPATSAHIYPEDNFDRQLFSDGYGLPDQEYASYDYSTSSYPPPEEASASDDAVRSVPSYDSGDAEAVGNENTLDYLIDAEVYTDRSKHTIDLKQLQQCMKHRNSESAIDALARVFCAEPSIPKVVELLIKRYLQDISIACLWFLPHLFVFQQYLVRRKKKSQLKITAAATSSRQRRTTKFTAAAASDDAEPSDRSMTVWWCNDQVVRNFAFFLIELICAYDPAPLAKTASFAACDFDLSKRRDLVQGIVPADFRQRPIGGACMSYMQPADDPALIVPLNEIVAYLTQTELPSREEKIAYWLSWIADYEKQLGTPSQAVATCAPRKIQFLDAGSTSDDWPCEPTDWVILVWNMVASLSRGCGIDLWIQRLFVMFMHQYTKAKKKAKLVYLLIAIKLKLAVGATRGTMTDLELPTGDVFQHAMISSLSCNLRIFKAFHEIQHLQ